MTIPITHHPERQRFEARIDGVLCEIDYVLSGNTMTITHTGVPPAVGGRGVAAALTESALTTAREHGWRVVPACSYADAYIRRHPQYADLLKK